MLEDIKPSGPGCGELTVSQELEAHNVFYGEPALFHQTTSKTALYKLDPSKKGMFFFGPIKKLKLIEEIAVLSQVKGVPPTRASNDILVWKRPVPIKEANDQLPTMYFNIKRMIGGERVKRSELANYPEITASDKWDLGKSKEFLDLINNNKPTSVVDFGFVNIATIQKSVNPSFRTAKDLNSFKIFPKTPTSGDIRQINIGYCSFASIFISFSSHGSKSYNFLKKHMCLGNEKTGRYITIKFYRSSMDPINKNNSVNTIKYNSKIVRKHFYIKIPLGIYSVKSIYGSEVELNEKEESIYNDYTSAPWFYFYQLAISMAFNVNLLYFIFNPEDNSNDKKIVPSWGNYCIPGPVTALNQGSMSSYLMELLTGCKAKSFSSPLKIISFQLKSMKITINEKNKQIFISQHNIVMQHNLIRAIMLGIVNVSFIDSEEIVNPKIKSLYKAYQLFSGHSYACLGFLCPGDLESNLLKTKIQVSSSKYAGDAYSFYNDFIDIIFDSNFSQKNKDKKFYYFKDLKSIYLVLMNPHVDRKGGYKEITELCKSLVASGGYKFYGATQLQSENFKDAFFLSLDAFLSIYENVYTTEIWKNDDNNYVDIDPKIIAETLI